MTIKRYGIEGGQGTGGQHLPFSRAVEAGVTVELIRSSRHHNGDGNWGDLLIPVITKKG